MHLFQMIGDGLRRDFPPLRTVGAASSLPVPPTPLVGRDGELAELTAVLRSPGVRLVTLTGPGGAGKTRLAIGVAQRLVETMADGVYFVPLAAVTTTELMWTTIAETLDIPPEGRIPPMLLTNIGHRAALMVLDNLEQLAGASDVVAELLESAPHIVMIATSRRPLNVSGELQHAVPPLGLPEDTSFEEAQRSGAVQLFVHHARAVKSSFTLNPANAADVVQLCRRLDGLPLAIELAAARSKILSPQALLPRLDKALDIPARRQVPSRQRTLRDTIAWSYDLLSPTQQTFFRELGVFSGGADLDAIAAVTTIRDDSDALDLVADLVDASLVNVSDGIAGEPRAVMLETIRAYALERLTSGGELEMLRDRHALHYLQFAEQLRPSLFDEAYLVARARFEAEHDNFNEALSWILRSRQPSDAIADRPVGLRLCLALYAFWNVSGYFTESRQWLEQAIDHAGGIDSPELARCLSRLSQTLRQLGGSPDVMRRHAIASVRMWRRMPDTSGLARALCTLAHTEEDLAHPAAARALFEEAVAEARALGDEEQLSGVLWHFAEFESVQRNFGRFTTLNDEALGILRRLGDRALALFLEQSQARALRHTGRVEQAQSQMRDLIPQALKFNEPQTLVALAEDYAAVLFELGEHPAAIRLLGAADAFRERLGTPRNAMQQADIAEPIAKGRTALTADEWDGAYRIGRTTSVEDALREVTV